ncbi:hypothetical protein [Variovorax paradoxus]|uniref:hypothetical protein n=1 Tax=Variovorax paradoxus TaxID=34073 RepID=UPI001ABCE53A
MFKIEGLDKLAQELKEAETALAALDGELGTVSFDPNDPESIEHAIMSVESLIDQRIAQYSSNTIIAPLAADMKSQYRQSILDEAAAARLKGNAEE